MKYTISGDNLQIANIEILPNSQINAESGAMIYKSGNVNIEVESKGIKRAFKRILGGESLFLTRFSSVGGSGLVGVGGNVPGKIKVFKLKAGETLIAERGAYLCSDTSIDISVTLVKKIGAGLFGGEGILLQKLTGPGTVLLHAAGDLIEYNLESGQRLDVDTGHIVAFDPSITYDIRKVGSVKTMVFGGEGLFLAQMTGPGKVVLQSMTKNMLKPQVKSSSRGGAALGGILRGMAKK